MYCPNCGKKTSEQQQFCRFCGLALERVAQSLAEQRSVNLDESLQEKKEKLERWGFIALCVCGVGILLPILYKIVNMLVAGQILSGLGILAVVVVVGCGLLSAILFEEAKEIEAAKNKGRIQPKEETGEKTTARLLPEGSLEAMPSVTERTTELLYLEKRGNVRDD